MTGHRMGGKGSDSRIPADFLSRVFEPARTTTKHLTDCSAVVFILSDYVPNYKPVATHVGIDEGHKVIGNKIVAKLGKMCKGATVFSQPAASYATTGAETAQGKDIAIIMFHYGHERVVEKFVSELRKAQPGIYVVICSSVASDVPRGMVDSVLDKPRVFGRASERYLKTPLTTMLANEPLQNKKD